MDAVSEPLSREEAVKLGAADSEFFCRYFFPKTFRRASPAFHKEVWASLENPNIRYLNEVIFRDGAKTTIARAFCAKRIAYGLSRTLFYLGASEADAARSALWLRNAVDRNKLFAETFGLVRGSKWNNEECEIVNTILGQSTWVAVRGLSGSVRGVNFDDYRPETIVCDDILTDENCLTHEQREKTTRLVLGAIYNSLAPRSDEPNAKLVLLNTPQHKEDCIAEAEKNPLFHTVKHGCWTEETKDLPVEQQVSAWEDRVPTEELRAEKMAAVKMQRLSIFAREKEVKLITVENAAFRSNWLRLNDVPPPHTYNVMAIDPVPPPSERQMQKGLVGKDYECIAVVGRLGEDNYVKEYVAQKGHEPNWTVNEVFRLYHIYRPAVVVVEAVGYQRTLKTMLETEMRRRGIYFVVKELNDGRAKYTRIVDALSGPASQGLLHCRTEHTTFIEQFENYGPTYSDHDDVIDCVSMAVAELSKSAPRLPPPPLDNYAEHYGKPKLIRRAP